MTGNVEYTRQIGPNLFQTTTVSLSRVEGLARFMAGEDADAEVHRGKPIQYTTPHGVVSSYASEPVPLWHLYAETALSVLVWLDDQGIAKLESDDGSALG